jgi:hypothetical protein
LKLFFISAREVGDDEVRRMRRANEPLHSEIGPRFMSVNVSRAPCARESLGADSLIFDQFGAAHGRQGRSSRTFFHGEKFALAARGAGRRADVCDLFFTRS